jgi:hypothetical protein
VQSLQGLQHVLVERRRSEPDPRMEDCLRTVQQRCTTELILLHLSDDQLGREALGRRLRFSSHISMMQLWMSQMAIDLIFHAANAWDPTIYLRTMLLSRLLRRPDGPKISVDPPVAAPRVSVATGAASRSKLEGEHTAVAVLTGTAFAPCAQLSSPTFLSCLKHPCRVIPVPDGAGTCALLPPSAAEESAFPAPVAGSVPRASARDND